MKNIFWGAVLIAVGFILGESIFLGDRTIMAWIFDGLGMLFIAIGLVQVIKRRQRTA